VFSFNLTLAQSVSIAKPYIELSAVTTSQTVKIRGTSTSKQCEVTLDITFVDDGSNILIKKKIEDMSFKVDPM